MTNRKDGGAAFPFQELNDDGSHHISHAGLTVRDWFATWHSPSDDEITREMQRDKNLNPYNDYHKPKLRDKEEIVCHLKYKHADAMLAEREKAGSDE